MSVFLKTWKRPCFDKWRHWIVYADMSWQDGMTAASVREMTGHEYGPREEIAAALENPSAVNQQDELVTVRDAPISVEALQRLLAEMSEARIPLQVMRPGCGLDGTWYGVEYEVGLVAKVNLAWWSDLPEEWRSFTRVVRKLQRYLHLCVLRAGT